MAVKNVKEEAPKAGIVPKIFNGLGLLFCVLFLFMGLMYTFRGNIFLGAFISLFVLICLVLVASFIETQKTRKRKEINKVPERFGIACYTALALIIFPFIFHFIDVDFARKGALKKAGKDKLAAVNALRDDYRKKAEGKVNSFKDAVKIDLDAYMLSSGSDRDKYREAIELKLGEKVVDFEEFEDGGSREDLVEEVENAIKPKVNVLKGKYNLGAVNLEWDEYYKTTLPIFENWSWLKVSHAYYDIENMYNKVYKAAKEKMPDFEYKASLESKDMMLDSPFSSLSQTSILKLLLILVINIGMHFCILVPYLMAKRAPGPSIMKATGSKDNETFSNEVNL